MPFCLGVQKSSMFLTVGVWGVWAVTCVAPANNSSPVARLPRMRPFAILFSFSQIRACSVGMDLFRQLRQPLFTAKSEVRGQRSEVRGQRSEIRDQKSE